MTFAYILRQKNGGFLLTLRDGGSRSQANRFGLVVRDSDSIYDILDSILIDNIIKKKSEIDLS
jgi:hypothetical protein